MRGVLFETMYMEISMKVRQQQQWSYFRALLELHDC